MNVIPPKWLNTNLIVFIKVIVLKNLSVRLESHVKHKKVLF